MFRFERARLYSLRKNAGCKSVLKGRGFKPRRKGRKIIAALAAEGCFRGSKRVFSSLFSRAAQASKQTRL
jgi:hypothetical protein